MRGTTTENDGKANRNYRTIDSVEAEFHALCENELGATKGNGVKGEAASVALFLLLIATPTERELFFSVLDAAHRNADDETTIMQSARRQWFRAMGRKTLGLLPPNQSGPDKLVGEDDDDGGPKPLRLRGGGK